MQWSWKESNGLERTIYVPYFDCIACIFNKNRSNEKIGKNSKILSFLPCVGHIEQKWLKNAGDLTYLTAYGWTYTSYDPRL